MIAGVLAFAAVQWQMWDQRRTLRQEQEKQNRAIASAILYEIGMYRRLELEQVEKTLCSWDPASGSFPSAGVWRQNSFELYKANSYKLGFLNARSVSAIVKSYAMAGIYEGFVRDYQGFLDLGVAGMSQVQVDKHCREQIEQICDLLPPLKKLASEVCISVARDCGLDELIERSDAQTH